VYQVGPPEEWEENAEHADQFTRPRPTPAISNCSIRKAAQPWKTQAVPTEPFISFDYLRSFPTVLEAG